MAASRVLRRVTNEILIYMKRGINKSNHINMAHCALVTVSKAALFGLLNRKNNY